MNETRQYIFQNIFEIYGVQQGYYIDPKWVFSAKNNAPFLVKKNFDNELQQMLEDDFFEYKEGHGETWFLTQKGEQAFIKYLNERENTMQNNSHDVNINFNPTITQTNSQTMLSNYNIDAIFEENGVKKETVAQIKEIANLSISKEEKQNELLNIIGKLSFNVISKLLVSLILKGF